MAKLNDTNNDGLPTNDENKRVEDFENKLNILLNPDVKKRNALFLGRIIWNDSVELIWRVHNAEEIYQIILDIIKQKKYVFSFDYRIDPDAEWKLAEWHLEDREYDIQIS